MDRTSMASTTLLDGIAHLLDVHLVCSLRPSACAGMRQLDAEYRLDKNIKIAMLYLEDDDAVSAEAFIKKASALIGSCKARAARGHPTPWTPNFAMRQIHHAAVCTF